MVIDKVVFAFLSNAGSETASFSQFGSWG